MLIKEREREKQRKKERTEKEIKNERDSERLVRWLNGLWIRHWTLENGQLQTV